MSMLSTVVSGCSATHSSHVVRTDGKKSSCIPLDASGPAMGSPGELVPQRLRRAVVHHLVALVEHAGRAERGGLPVYLCGIHDPAEAERSVGERNGLAS